MVTEIKTDIIEYIETFHKEEPDKNLIVIHQANCFNTLHNARGVARPLGKHFPQIAYADDDTTKGFKAKLGSYTYAKAYPNVYIFNAYGQYDYGNGRKTGKVYTQYSRLDLALTKIKAFVLEHKIPNPVFFIPKLIGQGLANGNPDIIQPMVKKIFEDQELVLFYN